MSRYFFYDDLVGKIFFLKNGTEVFFARIILKMITKLASGEYIKIRVVPCGSTLFLESTDSEMSRFFYAKN